MSNRFGWRSGTLKCQNAKIQGDLYVQDDIVFSDVSAGALGVTGGIDMTGTTSAIGINLTGGSFATAGIAIGTATGTPQTMAEAEDFAIAIFTTCADTDGANTATPLYVNAAYSGGGQVARAAEFVLRPTAQMGGWCNAIKGYTDFAVTAQSGGSTGLASAICAEMRLPNGACSGAFFPLEIEWVGQTNTSFGIAGSGSNSGFISCAAGGDVDEMNADGVFMTVNGLSAGATNLLSTNSQTLKCDIGYGTTRYLLLSQAADNLTLSSAATVATLTVASTGSSRVAPIDVIWTSDATYGTGDRIRGTGGMSACLNIGNATAAAAITGDGDHLAIYTNMDISVAITGDTTVMGGGYHVVSLKTIPTQHMGIIAPVTGYARNEVVCNGSTEFIASRGVIYTASDAESVSQTAGEFSIIDATGTRATTPDIKAVLINLNVADNNVGGGNVVGLQLEENGALAATEGILFKIGTFTKGIDFQDQCTTAIDIGDCTTGISFTGTTARCMNFETAAGAANSGTKGSTAGGYITVYVDGATRYINCVTGV